jgi:hypothetical protein
MRKLVLGNVNDNDADAIFGKVLLELKVPIDRHAHVELSLWEREKGTIF